MATVNLMETVAGARARRARNPPRSGPHHEWHVRALFVQERGFIHLRNEKSGAQVAR